MLQSTCTTRRRYGCGYAVRCDSATSAATDRHSPGLVYVVAGTNASMGQRPQACGHAMEHAAMAPIRCSGGCTSALAALARTA